MARPAASPCDDDSGRGGRRLHLLSRQGHLTGGRYRARGCPLPDQEALPRFGGPDGWDRSTAYYRLAPRGMRRKVRLGLGLDCGCCRDPGVAARVWFTTSKIPPSFRSAPRVEDVLRGGGGLCETAGREKKRKNPREFQGWGGERKGRESSGDEEVESSVCVRQDTGLRVALRRGAVGARGGACAKVVQSEVSGCFVLRMGGEMRGRSR
ncbi:hypothetical protein F5X68DRAFT_32649 [Plectosphaerella plurivora]|uniref:Uncharacterized protein n=1 Tax=Plectosphaerella plurivora TaxID=936078 RepID=A0A9P8VMS1_9PEZI|nr:hypothetical protein F5X68DRAFT_32649 [Plectosphaerella plurivora]